MHLYVTFQGRYKTGQSFLSGESWQTGLRFLPSPSSPDAIGSLPADNDVHPVPATHNRDETNWTIVGNWNLEMGINDLDPADWLHDQLAPAWITLFNSSWFSSLAWTQYIRVYPIGENGRTAPAPPYATGTPVTLTMKSETVADGGGAATLCPPQLAIVASLRTAQIGSQGRGRMFLPALAQTANLNADGSFSAPGTKVANVDTFLESVQINNGVDPTGTWCSPAVVPRATVEPRVYALVNSVRMGNVFDTQRRRRRQLVETYSSASVSNPI